jgi:hypothetical protein
MGIQFGSFATSSIPASMIHCLHWVLRSRKDLKVCLIAIHSEQAVRRVARVWVLKLQRRCPPLAKGAEASE